MLGQNSVRGIMVYYLMYIISISVIWSIITISNFVVMLTCFYGWNSNLNIFISLSNFGKVLGPLILSFVRFSDPKLRAEIARIFKKKGKLSQEFLNCLEEQMFLAEKISTVNTIFLGVQMSNYYPNQEKIKINAETIQQTFELYEDQFVEGLMENNFYLNCTCQVLHARSFHQLRDKDPVVEFQQSFDLRQNIEIQITKFNELQAHMRDPANSQCLTSKEQLKKTLTYQGEGKSGATFYITHDRTALVKTIKNHEIDQIQEKFELYFAYISKNPQTLINPLMGVYKFSSPLDQSFMIQKYICPFDQRYVLRRYDLKGS